MRGQIDGPDEGDVVVHIRFAGSGQFAVAAGFGREIDDDAAGLHASTIAAVMMRGALRPGTAAVVTITSTFLRCSAKRFCCSARSSAVSSRA
jgi:hypothetical protein